MNIDPKIMDSTVSLSGNADLQTQESFPLPWIWDGVLVEEAITLLAAPEKTGKTTLLSLLLDRRRAGGQLLGRPVRPGATVLCSEETRALWSARQPPLNFGDQLQFIRPMKYLPPRKRWRGFIDHLLGMGETAFDLLVIDTASHFLPFAENNPLRLRRELDELRVVADGPAAVLLLHQASPPRNRSKIRGPLAAYADILIDMRVPPGDTFTRRRHFDGFGRYPGTIQHVAAELNAEGTDYLLLPDDRAEPATNAVQQSLQQLLGESAQPLTRQEILERWPSGRPPAANSLWRSLTRACESGQLTRSGAGTKSEPFRYEAK